MTLDIKERNVELNDQSATGIIAWIYETFSVGEVKLSTSFGAEGVVLIDLLTQAVKEPRVFTIDTGRNFQETYDLWQEVIARYKIAIEAYYPDPADIATLVNRAGPNLFYESVENRKQCCHVRKVKPLQAALADAKVWISGLRRQQGDTRNDLDIISWVEAHQVYKICPLANWFESNVWDYVRNNNVPYNKLHDQGFPTIGCAPCTRPVRPAEDMRAGRWWWETSEKKECGIHVVDGKIQRKEPGINFNI